MFLVLNFLMLAFFDFDFTASGMSTLIIFYYYIIDYLLIFKHTVNWSNPACGVKLPALVFHAYKVKFIQDN